MSVISFSMQRASVTRPASYLSLSVSSSISFALVLTFKMSGDVEMKPVDDKPKTKEEKEKEEKEKKEKKEKEKTPPPPPTPVQEIKTNIQLIERGVQSLEPRFTHRVLRSLTTLRRKLNEKVLKDAVEEVHVKGKFIHHTCSDARI